MAWTRTDIANRALGILGVKEAITDVDTDTSREAKAIRAVLDIAIESIASEFDWPYTRRKEEMTLIDGSASEAYNNDWQYAYQYSTYWVKFFRVQQADGGDRNPTDESKIPYEIISYSSGRLILTDQEDASADVAVLPEEGFYPAKYIEALAYLTAMMAGPRLEGATKKSADLRPMYESVLSSAKATAANESNYEMPPDTTAVRARRGNLSRRWNWRVGDPLQ